jgi:replicative DNA helicase
LERDETREAIQIPWTSLQQKTGGLRTEELTILTGDTGHGKSTYAINLVYFAAKLKIKCFIASLEMGPGRMMQKFFQIVTGRPQTKDNAAQAAFDFTEWAKQAPIYYLDKRGFVEWKMLALYIAWAALKQGCRLILIDHFHSTTRPGMEAADYERQAADMQALAGKLGISLLVICHPSKIRGDGKEREIEMDELKGSSGIKQYADNVWSVFYDKKNSLSRLSLHKIRDDSYGRFMGSKITYELQNNLLFKELD